MSAGITVTRCHIDATAAHEAVGAAMRKAAELGVAVNIAVVDGAGVLVAFARMNGAFLHSAEIAIDKAYTAAGFGFATGEWDRVLGGAGEAVRQGLSLRPRLVMFGGGLPIRVEGELVGAIGVSGGSEAQDEVCAEAGIAALVG
ncbi:GlcG/HbpS family heme-binding protein [Derxia gummosa]|uniref:GlcG/HbpS family heme-binding protein n=1 Tax=Derxia gummosa DSM 723 TaxID=1121388 RepID=A0A8B6X7V9_9BURK|nr:heme-binding protein [Derxia gummosa]